MRLFKKKITEPEAASHFVGYVLDGARDHWPTYYKSFKKNYKAKFVVEDEKTAAFDLFLAATTLDLQAVKNLFSNDQTERIEKWVFKIIDTKDWGEYAIDEVKKYDEEFQKGLQNINEGTGGPLSAVTARLVRC